MKICILGTGYVGLVNGTCFSDLGNNVICVDRDAKKIESLNSGKIPIYEPGLEELVIKNFKQKRLSFSTDIDLAIKKSNIIFICVGTPTNKKTNTADLKYVFQVSKKIKKNLNSYKIIVFLREGEAIRDFIYPDRVVIGTNSLRANRVMKSLYLPIIKKTSRYFKTSRRAAELIKYASNAFLATKISFINEVANLCEKTGVDIKDISLGMGLDQRIGDRFLRAGPGYGGSCFPKDTRAIVTIAKKFKINLSIIKTVIKSNDERSKILLNRILNIMNNKIKSKNITFLGVTFKAYTDDMRESPSLKLIPMLLKKGANIIYYEPTGKKNEFSKYKKVKYQENISSACKKSDLIILQNEWNEFKQLNFNKLVNKANFKIFDLRNLYSPKKMNKTNIKYFGVGR